MLTLIFPYNKEFNRTLIFRTFKYTKGSYFKKLRFVYQLKSVLLKMLKFELLSYLTLCTIKIIDMKDIEYRGCDDLNILIINIITFDKSIKVL